MAEVKMNGKDGSKVESVNELVGQFFGELTGQLARWRERLDKSPGELVLLEQEVQIFFAKGADFVIAGLLAVTMGTATFSKASEAIRTKYSHPLGRGRKRTVQMRLLGGLVIWVTSLYCEPRKKASRNSDKPIAGLYIELAQLGGGKGVSPGLQSRVARKVALSPSLRMAGAELAREGVKMDDKTVRRITYQCGEEMLKMRKDLVEQWRIGKLPVGDELAGKRVSVQVDGGRMKIRKELTDALPKATQTNDDGLPMGDAPGRSRKVPKKTYQADWREPKLMTIFIHDEHGKMVKETQATIDGTLLGPDSIAELMAMHLHRLGASKALSVTFVGDGAAWIWDRVDQIIKLAKLEGVPTYQVLDNCHAAHHISLALKATGISDEDRLPLFRSYRTLLRNGHWREVIDDLTEEGTLDLDLKENEKLRTEINYLQKHGEAGRLRYTYFRTVGIPLGSGAIESSIRRVINMRLKSNAMFWRQDHAEAMLQVRASVISDRWDAHRVSLRQYSATRSTSDWRWTPAQMSIKKIEDSQATAT